jgi:hypothetical protein
MPQSGFDHYPTRGRDHSVERANSNELNRLEKCACHPTADVPP